MPDTADPTWPHDGLDTTVDNASPAAGRPASPWTTGPSPAAVSSPAVIRSSPSPAGGAPPAGGPHRAEPPPTLDDLLADRPAPPTGPARTGWRAAVGRVTGGLITPGPGPAELSHRLAVQSVQRSLRGPKTVVVVNPKGGAHKTTATLLLAATFGVHRGGYVLAWDNNETRGTLGWRATPARHTNTAVDLLGDLDRFNDRSSRVGDLDNYVRSQGDAQFDVLASDEDAAGAASIDADAFRQMHRTLSRFYRILCIDTGNNMRASNWRASIETADQLVIVSTIREDTSQSAAWLADALRATGHEALVENAVTVLAAPTRTPDTALRDRLHRHFGKLTRAVLDVPHDPALVAGGPVAYDALSPASRSAWLRVTAAVADGL
ncbi:MinD/ParA family ATP-binding protein [Actinoplanes sp. G11-F43]|uniref:MinD/ParA family ATP-binding protein n=1 Tax=Actinoplanes sp. G11-F43 TaxID=3424130 RepID=UPI003D353B01